MKPVIFTYCEGSDTKLIVAEKEKDKIKILRAATFDIVQPSMRMEAEISGLKLEGDDLALEGVGDQQTSMSETMAISSVSLMNDALKEFNLNKSMFVTALTEPAIYYHNFDPSKLGKSAKVNQEIALDIQEAKNITVDKENLGYVELADKSLLAVFLSGEVGCIKLINALANHNGKRYYKIPSVKSAEISLAYYVAKRKKFFPDDQSLIVYIGKEYSKLIFLQGRKLKHIGTTLDIGTANLHTYDVYFSKILLEMENGGISSLDNIIVCGEDDSENLILSFYGTFPEANVSRLEFSELDTATVDAQTKERLSSFSVPISVAQEYFDELEKTYSGINLLPRYVKEDQKIFQFAWHGFAILPLLFVAAFFITQRILINQKQIKTLDDQIAEQTYLMKQNQAILDKISTLQAKINGFSQTQTILDSASVGTGVWSNLLSEVSGFIAGKKNIWITKLAKDETGKVYCEGYSLSKDVLTEFAYSIKSAELKSVNYEAIRNKNTYKFNLIFSLSNFERNSK